MKNLWAIFIFGIFVVVTTSFDFTTSKVKKTTPNKIKVAVFKGNGAGDVSVVETLEALRIDSWIEASTITSVEISEGKLDQFDALIFPGGSGSTQLLELGENGKQKVLQFVKIQGKGVVGICAGAYLLSSTEGYPNLALASSIHLDRDHYNRGRGLVEFKTTTEGDLIFPELKNQRAFMQYYDGPVLWYDSNLSHPNYTEMGKFISDIHPDDKAPSGITPGKSFILAQSVEKGRVFLMAGHPESTPGLRWMVPRMVRWTCNQPLISYHSNWVRPQFKTQEVFFDRDWVKSEKELFWQLFDSNPKLIIEAMNKLQSMESRSAVRWYIGLTRNSDAQVRQNAARLIALNEYTDALDDLKEAYKIEQDATTKSLILKSIDVLQCITDL
jgi:putative intracellular protease/amidase